MGMKKLFMDIDDTVLDTENYIRRVLGGDWLGYEGLIYLAFDEMSDDEMLKVKDVYSHYENIPYVVGAEDGLRLLKTEYDVIFCSSYHSEEERKSKEEWAEGVGIPIVLCKGFTKCNVDMSNSITVDDNTLNLSSVNAEKKICFYRKNNFFGLHGEDIVFDWFTLVDKLCPSLRSCSGLCSISY